MDFFDGFDDFGLEDLALAGALAEELADERREWEKLKREMEKDLEQDSDSIERDCYSTEDYDPSP
jgi:hypothetical protein